MIRRPAQLIVLATAMVMAAGLARAADEFDALRLRWRDSLTQGTNASLGNPLYLNWINSVGSSAQSHWNSLNTDPGRTYLWSAYAEPGTDSSDITGSYQRLRTMALGYAVNGSALQNNAALRSAIISALDWLNTHHYNETNVVYDNWFDFEIASPQALIDTTVLLHDDLSAGQLSNYMNAVGHFSPSPYYSAVSTNETSANKVWKSQVTALRGILIKDAATVGLGRDALSDVFPYVTRGDGFYSDGSYIFHDFFPYAGGYGIQMLDALGAMMQLLGGSTWQITDPAQTNVFRWVGDAYQPFLRRGAMMQMVDGRYHTRTGDDHAEGHEALGAILRLAQIASPADAAAFKSLAKGQIQADTYRNYVASQIPPYNVWANAALSDTNVIALVEVPEHRQFPNIDRVVHHRPNWSLGLAMSSWRVANYESTRGENLRGWFTADGMTYLYNDELGYYSDNFWSTVDPYRMPGTTVEAYVRTNGSGDAYRSPTNNQVGGATILNAYGVAAMHLNAWGSTLSARKSWFMFDNEIVCLGNSVSGGTNGAAETIIENRKLGLYGDNAFTVNGSSKPASPGWSETLSGTSWAHLAGTTLGGDIGYYFPPAATVKALRESRSGAMKDINTTYGSSTRSTRHYLTLYFDHGTNPAGGTYSYVILPGMSSSAVSAYAANPDITVLQNNSIATAVRENKLGVTAVNYWRDTSNGVAGVGFDRKAAAIWRNDGNILEIGVSDPTQTNSAGISVDLNLATTATLQLDPGVVVLQASPLRLWFGTSNTLGATLRAKFSVAAALTNTIAPVADAYVQNGAQSVTNFGEATTLAVKLGTTNQTRETFMRYDLTSVPGAVVGASLRLMTRSFDEPIYHAAAVVQDDAWQEFGVGGITWDTKPVSESASKAWLVSSNFQTLFVPLTELAQQAAAVDGILSLRIYSTGTNGIGGSNSAGFVAYGAREQGTAANRPQLLVNYVRMAPTVSLSSPEDGAALNAPATVTLTADATDADGVVSSVQFYCGAVSMGQLFAPPFSLTVPNLSPSNYVFSAVATDNSGLTATSTLVSVSVHASEPVGRGTGLSAEYFSDRNLTALALARTDTNINFSWSFASPGVGVPADNFSARWMGRIQARYAGWHQFHTTTDEGVRLWVDGRLIIDNWNSHFLTEDTGGLLLVAGRYYEIVMEYFDASSTATAKLSWTPPGMAKEIIPSAQLYPASQGLRGTYYATTNLTGPVLTRVDDVVNFNWNTNSPEPTALTASYGARWTGKVKANASGLHEFFTLSDDAVRLWVNGQLIISNWSVHPLTEDSNSILLVAGQFYDVTMEYFNLAGAGTAILSWKPPGEAKSVIPASSLTPYQNNNPPTLGVVPDQMAARLGPVTFVATGSDPDLPAQALTFSLDPGAPVGSSIHPTTGVFTWTPGPSEPFGPRSLVVRVLDNGVPQMSDAQTVVITVLTNMAAATVTLVSTGAAWRFRDDGMDQGTAWRGLNFNDGSWSQGRAAFGYGIGGETTLISFGPNTNNKYPTTYFRRAVYIPDPSLVQSITARMLRDDGAVVYLNGLEVWRNNLPAGTINHSTLATTEVSGPAQTQFISTAISPAALIAGTNVIAVELHQSATNTPDARFDLELLAQAFVPSEQQVAIGRAGDSTVLAWPQAAGLLQPFGATNLTAPVIWSAVTNVPALSNGSWRVVLPGGTNGTQFYRLQTP